MPVSETSQEQTEITRRRYDRIAPIYDVMEWPLEFRFRRWRENLWKLVGNTDTVLELGVGTGKNIGFYPAGADITAIDISEQMVMRARRRAERRGQQSGFKSQMLRIFRFRQRRSTPWSRPSSSVPCPILPSGFWKQSAF